MSDSEGSGLASDSEASVDVARELAVLRSELAARDKTIRVLIGRVEGQFARRESPFAVLEQNISLEQKVQRRTRDLEQSHEILSRTLLDLKLAQGQLLEANKLEAIGQLAAGVAHEINTPIQYVSDNTGFLKDAFEQLFTVLDETRNAVREANAVGAAPALVRDLGAKLTHANLSWICEQVPRAIDQSLEGLDRVAAIVRALKEFSHPGSDEKQLVDLRDAIEATVTVARHEWKYLAVVETQFDHRVPEIPCLRNEFNQVVLNLIVNAAHAIAEKTRGECLAKGVITIATELIGEEVEIRIRDNGSGIPLAIAGRIYDPFFTTKPVGKGTGQGLSIARAVIVKKHGGTIRFETAIGEGTCFFIRLPTKLRGSMSPPAQAVA